MSRAFVFPGQGSQAVGMGRGLADASAAAREVFEEVDEALGQKLSRLMFEGPEDELTLTENAQPAIMAVSIAVVRLLEREGGIRLSDKAAFVAGHSLGEYSALCAAGSLSLDATARLLRLRGRAMQAAVPVGVGAMAALLGLDLDAAVEVAGEVCTAANDNAPGQVVVSGHKGAIERAVEIAKGKGAKRAILLPVSAPFHCPLMAPAAEAMEKALADADIRAPFVPVDLLKPILAELQQNGGQVGPVAATLDQFLECGGKVLGPMIKRIERDATTASLTSMDEVEAFLKTL